MPVAALLGIFLTRPSNIFFRLPLGSFRKSATLPNTFRAPLPIFLAVFSSQPPKPSFWLLPSLLTSPPLA
jgi:hypothetical protein